MSIHGRSCSARSILVPFVALLCCCLSHHYGASCFQHQTLAAHRKPFFFHTASFRLKMSSNNQDPMAYNAMVSSSVDLSNAYVSDDILRVTRTCRDIDANKKQKYLYNIAIPKTKEQQEAITSNVPPSQIASDVAAMVTSPSGDKLAIFKNVKKDDDKEETEVEIWTNSCQMLSQRIVLPPKMHGKVCVDPNWFGQPSWNLQETALVYSAERKELETRSFFETKTQDDSSKETPICVGGQHTLGVGKTESWGEKYTKMSPLLDLFMLHVDTGNVGRVKNVPGHSSKNTTHGGYTLAQAVFTPCGSSIVYTAWDAGDGSKMPKRLGMIYCFQRPCQLYASPVKQLVAFLAKENGDDKPVVDDSPFACLTPNMELARSPRFNQHLPSEMQFKLVYWSCEKGYDTHGGAVSLCIMDWKDGNPVMDTNCQVVDMVDLPEFDSDNVAQVANMGFPGLFLNQLPTSCFAPSSDYVLLNTQWGSVGRIVQVSLETKTMTLLNVQGDADPDKASQSFLCFTRKGGAIVSDSAPNQPTVIRYVPPESIDNNADKATVVLQARLISKMLPIAASQVSAAATVPDISKLFDYKVITMKAPAVPGAADTSLQCILLSPKKDKKPPLIVVPHGGPHSCSSTTFVPSYAYLCAHGGYAVLFVNYRGSTGFGMAALNSLPGNVGVVDVADVVHATETVCDSEQLDASRVGICGGSHGGFLAAHLLGQFPQMFKAAAMRNPVTNIATMVSATDIPDWCYVESFGYEGKYDWTKFRGPTAQQLEAMWKASPIAHVENVKAPTLIAVGLSDKRVPPSQSLEYYHTLRSMGVKTKLLMYDKDDHAIDVVASEADHWINTKQWFDEHL